MAKKVFKEKHSWTKDEIKKVIKLWTSKSTLQLAEELGVRSDQVNYIASEIRKSGYKLPKKTVRGHLRSLIDSVVAEL